jgi:hypothetical protein
MMLCYCSLQAYNMDVVTWLSHYSVDLALMDMGSQINSTKLHFCSCLGYHHRQAKLWGWGHQ